MHISRFWLVFVLLGTVGSAEESEMKLASYEPETVVRTAPDREAETPARLTITGTRLELSEIRLEYRDYDVRLPERCSQIRAPSLERIDLEPGGEADAFDFAIVVAQSIHGALQANDPWRRILIRDGRVVDAYDQATGTFGPAWGYEDYEEWYSSCLGRKSSRTVAGDPVEKPSFRSIENGGRVEIEYRTRGYRGRLSFRLIIRDDGAPSAWLENVKHGNWPDADALVESTSIPLTHADLADLDERMATYRDPEAFGCTQAETLRVRWFEGSRPSHTEKFKKTCARLELLAFLELVGRTRVDSP